MNKEMKCKNEEFLEYIIDSEPELCPDENGEAYVCGRREVLVGNWCHFKKEYNVDCQHCELKEETDNE